MHIPYYLLPYMQTPLQGTGVPLSTLGLDSSTALVVGWGGVELTTLHLTVDSFLPDGTFADLPFVLSNPGQLLSSGAVGRATGGAPLPPHAAVRFAAVSTQPAAAWLGTIAYTVRYPQ